MTVAELAQALLRYTENHAGNSPFVTSLPGLTILRYDGEQRPSHRIYRPALCLTAQGGKSACFGEQVFHYGVGQALVVSVEAPGVGTVVEASPGEPYLGVLLEFDLTLMREVLEKLEIQPNATSKVERGIFVRDVEGPLGDSVLRLVRLLESLAAIPILYDSIMREICFWLLTGPQGSEIAAMTLGYHHSHGVVTAIHALREHFKKPVRIEQLARTAQMSASAFHRQFKAITSMTPLQYQKQLRLLEARRLLASQTTNVETAAFEVGYESPSQFSREYSRMFALPPRRHAMAFASAST